MREVHSWKSTGQDALIIKVVSNIGSISIVVHTRLNMLENLLECNAKMQSVDGVSSVDCIST